MPCFLYLEQCFSSNRLHLYDKLRVAITKADVQCYTEAMLNVTPRQTFKTATKMNVQDTTNFPILGKVLTNGISCGILLSQIVIEVRLL